MSPAEDGGYLHVPPVTRQYLISPPCSPPVGWEQPHEGKPIIDYDLLAAMAQLLPGKNFIRLINKSYEKKIILIIKSSYFRSWAPIEIFP